VVLLAGLYGGWISAQILRADGGVV